MKIKNSITKVLCLTLTAAFIIIATGSVAFAGIPNASNYFYVADYANVLSSDTENYILGKSESLENSTGAQIVVATVDFTDGMDLESYAYQMFNSWQIGSSNNDGLLILLSIGDDNYWVTQGSGLEAALSSGTIQTILDTYMEPYFAAKDYDNAVIKAYDQFLPIVQSAVSGSAGYSDYGTHENNEHSYNHGYENSYSHASQGSGIFSAITVFAGLIILIILLVIISRIFSMFRPRGTGVYNGYSGYRRPSIFPLFFLSNRPRHRRPPMGPGPGHGPGGPGGHPFDRPGSGFGGGSHKSGMSGGFGSSGGAGRSSGGGAGRSSHSGGGFSGSHHSGGGGSTRGGGAGRH